MPRVEGGPTTVGADKAILASTCAVGFPLPYSALGRKLRGGGTSLVEPPIMFM